MGLTERIKFFGPVYGATLAGFTRSADAGVCLEKDTNINYRYSLPNKLFDYIAAGIPVISGDLPETGKILRETGCGLIIGTITPESISEALIKLKTDKLLYKTLKDNAIKAFSVLNWKTESIQVKQLYGNVISKINDGKNGSD
jgi:glycosyltransferase involved in cell wall biosynthesis